MQNDTIAAIATAMSPSGIGIIRISGDDALSVIDRIYKSKNNKKKISACQSHTIHYGFIYDGDEKIDEVMVLLMKAPNTYTREDTVEIDCHGGVYVMKRVLEAVIKNGARPAEPGEFTKRAFLNGRIDLSQAEAISDLITANNDQAAKLALKGIQGNITNFIKDLKEDLIKIITQIEVNIDYPEYEDIEELTAEKLLPGSVSLRKKMDDILDRSKNMHLIKDGISTVIVGKPNVGKSSLLNALLEEDKAIVTDIAGTTRDVVEGSIRLNDIVLNMIDTAGIRETEDKIEHMGVKKSLSLIDQADLVLVVLDGSRPIEAEDKELLERTEGLNRIVLINKSDKGCVIDTEGIHISAKENHIDELIQHIKDEFDFSAITNSQAQVLANQRQVQLLDKASQSLNVAIQAMEDGIPTDLIVTDLYNSWENLKEILGEQAKEDLLDELFKRFCIGK